jgi:hypothetical protein
MGGTGGLGLPLSSSSTNVNLQPLIKLLILATIETNVCREPEIKEHIRNKQLISKYLILSLGDRRGLLLYFVLIGDGDGDKLEMKVEGDGEPDLLRPRIGGLRCTGDGELFNGVGDLRYRLRTGEGDPCCKGEGDLL